MTSEIIGGLTMKRLLSAALLKQQKAQGKTINLASHSAADIAQACDMVYEMADGSLALIS